MAILSAHGTTATSSDEEFEVREVIEPIGRFNLLSRPASVVFRRAVVAKEDALGDDLFSDSSEYTSRELLVPRSVGSRYIITSASNHWHIVEPSSPGKQGIEAAVYRFSKRVGRISELVAVTYSVDRDVCLIWTFIRRRDKLVRRQIYEQELELMREFAEIRFDFNVVALDRTEEQAYLPDDIHGQIVFYRQGAPQTP